MDAHPSVITELDDGVLLVTLNRTQRLNAIDSHMAEQLVAVWAGEACAPEVGAVVLSGAGPEAFSIGSDTTNRPTPQLIDSALRPRRNGLAVPLVVALNGIASAEALEAVADADAVVAATNARGRGSVESEYGDAEVVLLRDVRARARALAVHLSARPARASRHS